VAAEGVFFAFRKFIDFFDPKSTEYLLTLFLMQRIWKAREDLAVAQNLNPDKIVIGGCFEEKKSGDLWTIY